MTPPFFFVPHALRGWAAGYNSAVVATKDFYKVLGVDRKSSQDDIRKAFRKLARQYHPDANKGDAQAEKRFKEISEAYDVLGDPAKRAEYDNPVRQYANLGGNPFAGRPSGTGGIEFDLGDVDLGDLFGGIFNRGGAGTGPRARSAPQPAPELPVEISLREAIEGCKRLVTMASGKQIEVTFPTGVSDGSKVRAKGNTFVVRLVPEAGWRVEGRDVIGEVAVPDYVAVLGGEATATTPTGKKVSLNLRPGTRAGSTQRLRGRGIPGLNGGAAGDLLLRVRVTVPEQASEEQRALYEKLREASNS